MVRRQGPENHGGNTLNSVGERYVRRCGIKCRSVGDESLILVYVVRLLDFLVGHGFPKASMARYLFFETSRSAFQQVSDLFDFVWPTAVALWNLRWQVQGFAGTKTHVTKAELHGRFVLGSGVHSANIERACLDTTWEEQQGQFAK